MRWKWKELTGEEQRAITAISDLARPTEDAALREYCTEQGTWTPRDLHFLSGSEVSTLMLDQHEGYEPSVVVFYCLFLHGYGLYPFEPCTATPPQGEPEYPWIKGAASARVVGRSFVAVDREGLWKLTCQFYPRWTTYSARTDSNIYFILFLQF